MKIQRIETTDYNIFDYIIYPKDKREILHTIVVSTTEVIDIDFFTVRLLNSKSGFRYKVQSSSFHSNEYLYFNFIIDNQSTEKANIDYIELNIFGSSNYSLKSEVKTVELQTSNKALNYTVGDISIMDSNLLSIRSKIAAPLWSTSSKNIISNNSKMLDQYHKNFHSSYFKVNEYLRQAYTKDYESLSFKRIKVTDRPSTILKYKNGDVLQLKETEDINSSIKELNMDYDNRNIPLLLVILESYSENKLELEEINKILPSYLYFKNNTSSVDKYVTCVIEGYDMYDNRIVESLLVRYDLFTKTVNKFSKIIKINHGNSNIEVSNYVDLKSNHYVINNLQIIPPIIDDTYRTFVPLVKTRSNNETTKNIICLYNPLNSVLKEEIKFNIDTEDNQLGSYYITEDLDIIYTYFKANKTILNYSKLNIDYGKNIYNSTTLNNNKYVTVSDINTNINDWFNIKLQIKDWVQDTQDSVYMVQIKNNNRIYYYDVENMSLSENKVLNYNQIVSKDVIDFSIQVENDEPYLITLLSSDLKQKVTAGSITHSIYPYTTKVLNGYVNLKLYNNELIVSSENEIYSLTESRDQTDWLEVLIEYKGYNDVQYKLVFDNNYYISSTDTNINKDFYKYITKDNSYNTPISFKIDTNKLNSEIVKIGLGVNIFNGLITNTISNKITLKKGEYSITLDSPLNKIQEDVVVFDYEISLKNLRMLGVII